MSPPRSGTTADPTSTWSCLPSPTASGTSWWSVAPHRPPTSRARLSCAPASPSSSSRPGTSGAGTTGSSTAKVSLLQGALLTDRAAPPGPGAAQVRRRRRRSRVDRPASAPSTAWTTSAARRTPMPTARRAPGRSAPADAHPPRGVDGGDLGRRGPAAFATASGPLSTIGSSSTRWSLVDAGRRRPVLAALLIAEGSRGAGAR